MTKIKCKVDEEMGAAYEFPAHKEKKMMREKEDMS